MIVTAETEFIAEMGQAKEIAETLTAHYPGHLWAVTVRSGVAIIKALNISSLWGYVLKMDVIGQDAGIRAKEVMRAGGEILERAKLERGTRRAGEKIQAVDGIKNYQTIGVH